MLQKSWGIALLLAIILPGFDRLYLGYIGLGLIKFLTGGGCFVWWLVDIILIATGRMKDANGLELAR